jgi:arylformamidase
MKPKFFDLTPKISSRLGVFPGDQSFNRSVSLGWAKGDHLELSKITTTLHLGAHADAPSHYDSRGEDMASRDLKPYLGRCQVIRANEPRPGTRLSTRDFASVKIAAPRVLVDTQTFLDPNAWNSDFAALSPELIEAFADQGAILVGIDTPSIDPEAAKDLISHKAIFRRKLAVLEGLLLAKVPEGVYSLIALPLPIVEGDASPVRAILLSEDALASDILA